MASPARRLWFTIFIRYFSFDTEKNTWEAIKPMIDARHFASATVINGYIYVAGGGAYYNKPKSTSVELYDPKTDEWMSLNHMKKARENFVLVELNGFLYAMGGYDKSVERFDPLKNRWTEVGELNGKRGDSKLILLHFRLNRFTAVIELPVPSMSMAHYLAS